MTDKIVAITSAPAVDQELVDQLDLLLIEAKAGRIKSAMIAGHAVDGGCYTFHSQTDDYFRDLAIVERLKFRIMARLDAAQ